MRKTQHIKTNPVYAIVVDGDCESWYINMLKRNERHLNIGLKPELPQRKRLKEQYEKVCELAEEYTRVFWMVDYDVIIKQSRETPKGRKTAIQEFKEYYLKLKKKKNVTVIINNPCLEYWLLLHYEDAANKRYNNCDGVSAHLLHHCPSYKKTQDYYTRQNDDIYLMLKPHMEKAIARARNFHSLFDIETFDSNIACSQMHLLFDMLPGILDK